MGIVETALSLRQAGISVIPLRPKSKEPLFPWKEFQERKADESEIRGWFESEPKINVGAVTGRISGIAVVDIDGAVGLQSAAEIGIHSNVGVLSGRGKQLYFKYPEGDEWLKNSVRLFPGIDTRGAGGYVVAPGSLHPNGKRYQWVGSPLVSTQSLPPFPSAMFAAATTRSVEPNMKGWIGEALAGLAAGNRNDTFARICGKLHRDNWSAADMLNLLSPTADKVGFSRSELSAVIASVGRYQRTAEVNDQAQSETLNEFLKEAKPVEWIVPGIIARNSLGFVAGLPETGKTWLLIDLAIELTRLSPDGIRHGRWLDSFAVNPATVLFIDQERFKGETQRRFNAVLRAKGIASNACGDRLHIQCGTNTRIDSDTGFSSIRDRLSNIRPDIVIVDSFATFHTSEENDRGQIQKVLERLKQLRTEFGCSFIFIDHETKSVWNDRDSGEAPSAFRMAGSVGKAAAAEFVLTVRKGGSGTTVYHTKSTLGAAVDAFSVEIKDTENGGISVCHL